MTPKPSEFEEIQMSDTDTFAGLLDEAITRWIDGPESIEDFCEWLIKRVRAASGITQAPAPLIPTIKTGAGVSMSLERYNQLIEAGYCCSGDGQGGHAPTCLTKDLAETKLANIELRKQLEAAAHSQREQAPAPTGPTIVPCNHNTRTIKGFAILCTGCGEIMNWEPHTNATTFVSSEASDSRSQAAREIAEKYWDEDWSSEIAKEIELILDRCLSGGN